MNFVVAEAYGYKTMMPTDTRKVRCCSLPDPVRVHYPMVLIL
jgi:hypothetical protein